MAVYTPDEYPGQTRVRRLSDLLLLSSGGVFKFFDDKYFPTDQNWTLTVNDYQYWQLNTYGFSGFSLPVCVRACVCVHERV